MEQNDEIVVPDSEVIVDDPVTPVNAQAPTDIVIPDEDVITDEEHYSSLGQQAKTFAEGVAHGTLGPLATLAETEVYGVDPKEILARQKENPVTYGTGQATGLAVGMLTGTGEAALLSKAGKLASAEAVAKAAATQSIRHKIGSIAVREAAEGAVLAGSDEVSKMILQDPDQSAETAMSNIGITSVLGGTGGAMFASANPLWQATVGDRVGKALNTVKGHLDGTGKIVLPETIDAAQKTLGLDLDDLSKAIISGDERVADPFSKLSYSQNRQTQETVSNLRRTVEDSVLDSTGKTADDLLAHSPAQTGRSGMETLKTEYRAISEPISKEFNDITGPFKESLVGPSRLSELAENISDLALKKGYVGADIPQDKVVNAVLSRLETVKTAEDFKKLITTVGNITSENPQALSRAGRDMIEQIIDTQHKVLGDTIGEEAPHLMERYINARKNYAKLAKMSTELSDELSIGRFEGPETLLKKLESKRTPEQFLAKLSPAKNAEIVPWLAANFPQTLDKIRDNELANILKTGVVRAGKDQEINLRTMTTAIDKMTPEMRDFVIPPDLKAKIDAAATILDAIPTQRDSGTPGGLMKLLSKAPASVMAAIAGISGHNPLVGYIAGEMSQKLSTSVPDSIRLGYLKFLASDQPINAPAFKAMVDFMESTYKGENELKRASAAIFKAGAQVISTKQMPDDNDRKKLEKQVRALQENPQKALDTADSGVGYYLPNQQTGLTAAATRTAQYLENIRPKPYKPSPLDREIEPSDAEMARYERAQDIALKPTIVLDLVKKGIVQASDIQDLSSMYPSLYKKMAMEMTNNIMAMQAEDEPIPYTTRMGISLFLGQPMDSTMLPESIVAAQPMPTQGQPQQQAAKPRAKTSQLGKKTVDMYKTPTQEAEASAADRS